MTAEELERELSELANDYWYEEENMASERRRGLRFEIDAAKYDEVMGCLVGSRWFDEQCMRSMMLDYDWPNADQHQQWLEAASAAVIADWLHGLSNDR